MPANSTDTPIASATHPDDGHGKALPEQCAAWPHDAGHPATGSAFWPHRVGGSADAAFTWQEDPVTQARIDLDRPDVSRDQLARHVAALLGELDRAQRCPLTGLHNRDGWMRHAAYTAASRSSAVVCTNLDGLKAVNDRHGHDAGDTVLRTAGTKIDMWCNHTTGFPGRTGTGTFMALVPATPWMYVEYLDLRDALVMPVRYSGQLVRVGVSIGIAIVPPGPPHTIMARLESAVSAADGDMRRDRAARRDHMARAHQWPSGL